MKLAAVIALAVLAACHPRLPDYTFEGVRVWGSPVPRCVDATVRSIRNAIPAGGRYFEAADVFLRPAPFDCGGMLVWGCDSPSPLFPSVTVVASPTLSFADGAVVEEIGHWIWAPLCGDCEDWSLPTSAARDPRFWAWIVSTKATASAACKGAP